MPLAGGAVQKAAGYHIMNVGMILQLSSPGVEHTEEPGQIAGAETGFCSQGAQGLG